MAVLKREYFDSGELKSEVFEINGKKNGLYKEWHQKISRGIQREKMYCKYSNGYKDGLCLSWNEEGILIRDEYYYMPENDVGIESD